MVYQFSRFDRESNRELWRWRSLVSLRVEWLAAWLKRDRDARSCYRAWLYVQVSSGDLITRDMLSWRDDRGAGMWRLRYYRASGGGYRLELTTPTGFLYAYGHSSVIPDVESEAWLIHDAGLEGSQVDVQRSCAVGRVF